MAFKRLFPRRGTVIPENHRPPGSKNATLHEHPAYREYTHELKGVVLYLPWSKQVVVPVEFQDMFGMRSTIVHGDATYPRGGYDITVSQWELQRAQRVVLDLAPVDTHPDVRSKLPGVMIAECADGTMIKVRRETPVVVEPDPDAFDSRPADPAALHGMLTRDDTPPNRVGPEDVVHCRRCGLVLTANGVTPDAVTITTEGWQCQDEQVCSFRARNRKESE